jgi:predicted 3-demethylubiquinone-9 3-methyltransferase (glyoxalase superfamily)
MATPFSKIVPCVWLDDKAETAADFYARIFTSGRVIATSRYPAGIDNPGGKPRGSVLTVEFEIAGQRFTALNGGPVFVLNPSISFFVYLDAPGDVDRLYAALAEGGEALMPLDRYPWSERYGWIKDRFGVSWQVIAGRRSARGPMIAPCLMFSGAQHGRAGEAMRFYAGIFPEGKVESVERYAEGEGPTDTIKHGRFSLAGQELVAMDSHVEHGFGFNEALSLQVMCVDQPELDRYWEFLADGGQPGPCGWLKDRFGLSWQVVPLDVARWLAAPGEAGRERVLAALWKMQKIDIAELRKAFAGK